MIMAHNGLVRAKMFTDLDQMEEGDTFSLSILDRVLTYEVDQILVTLPSDIEPLQIVKGQDYVTLYTCTPYGVNTHRLLVRGTRVEYHEEEAAEAPMDTAKNLLQDYYMFFLIGGVCVTGIVIVVIRICLNRKRKK